MKPPSWLTRRNIVCTVIALGLVRGLFGIILELSALQAKRRLQPYTFSGDLFIPIIGATGSEKYLGYLTDRDIKDDKVAARFTQAQFTLAPLILDFNNSSHRLLLLDFQNPKDAAAVAQKLALRPLKLSPQGIIFAERQSP